MKQAPASIAGSSGCVDFDCEMEIAFLIYEQVPMETRIPDSDSRSIASSNADFSERVTSPRLVT